MKPLLLALSSAAFVLSGCVTMYGVSRDASVHRLPDLRAVKERIESYPEVKQVILEETEGGRPLTFTGIQKADEVFHLIYTDHVDVQGFLTFIRDYSGDVTYSQSLTTSNRRPPQSKIDATWPIMKRIEQDLARDFGLPELLDSVDVYIFGVDDPDRDLVVHP